jgi:hypothetical protein
MFFIGLIALIAFKWKFCVHSIIFYYSQHHIWLRSSSCSTVLQFVHQRPRLAMDPTPPLTLLTPSRQNPDCLYTYRPILVIDPFPPFTLFTLKILSPAWLHPQSCVASPSMLKVPTPIHCCCHSSTGRPGREGDSRRAGNTSRESDAVVAMSIWL